MRILISTSSFGTYDKKPLQALENAGFELVMNPHGRKLTKEETAELAKGCHGIVAGTEKYDKDMLNSLKELKVISRVGTGTDAIDLEAAKELEIAIFKTPDGPTDAVAELALALMLCVFRKISVMDGEVKNDIWKKRMGNLLKGKTVGIIGMGKIGRRLIELLKPFRCTVIANDPYPDGEWAKKNNVSLIELDKLLEESDIVSIHIPFSEETKHLINRERMDRMKDSAVIINTSRGGIVEETSLFDALKYQKLGGAALDVMEKEPYRGPLSELENVVLTPHVGSYAKECRIRMETEAVRNLIDYLGEAKQ